MILTKKFNMPLNGACSWESSTDQERSAQ